MAAPYHVGDQPRPPRLVRRAEAGAVVAVEVFVEEDEVPPVRVGLELLRSAVDRAPFSSRRKMRVIRVVSSFATSNRCIERPDPIGHSMVKRSP